MKTVTRTAENKNEGNLNSRIDYKFKPTEDSDSLKAWEEENAEYASWNLIIDEQDYASCWSEKASKGAFFMVAVIANDRREWSNHTKITPKSLKKSFWERNYYTQITGQSYWSPPGNVKGLWSLRMIIPGAATSATSCSVSFLPVSPEWSRSDGAWAKSKAETRHSPIDKNPPGSIWFARNLTVTAGQMPK